MLENKIKILTITLLTLLSTVSLNAAKTVSYDATVCGGGTYLFGCDKITPADGSGKYTLVLGDSTIYLNLLFSNPVTVQFEPTITAGQKYLFGCDVYTTDGATATEVLSPIAGCDSTVIMKLKVLAPANIMVRYEEMIEPNQVYLFGCKQISSATETPAASPLRDTLTLVGAASTGGDSIICLALHVKKVAPVMVRYEETIEPNQVYLFGCNQFSSATETPAASPLRDTLTLVGAASTGADSIICLALHVKKPAPVMVRYEEIIEPKQVYLFGCKQLSSDTETTPANPLRDTLTLVDAASTGGDSIICLALHVVKSKVVTYEFSETIETNQTYLFGCDTYYYNEMQTGLHELQNTVPRIGAIAGDSIIKLHLTVIAGGAPVKENITVKYETTIEPTQKYLFNCQTLEYATEGTYYETDMIDRVGTYGDSIINLTIHVAKNVMVAYKDTIEPKQIYLFGCNKLSKADETADTEPLRDTLELKTAAGGDSIVCLELHVKSVCPATPIMGVPDPTVTPICSSDLPTYTYTWPSGKTISFHQWIGKNNATHYRDTLCYDTVAGGSAKGCDTIHVLHMEVYYPAYTIFNTKKDTVCDGDTYTWTVNGNTYTIGPADYAVKKSYFDTIADALGQSAQPCDSLVYQLDLVVQKLVLDSVVTKTICYGDTYIWQRRDGSTIGTYTTTTTAFDTVRYAAAAGKIGCDSLRYTLNLTVRAKADTVVVNDTSCYNTDYDWYDPNTGDLIKTIAKPTAAVKDTVYKPYAGTTDCDSVVHVLNLFVHKEAQTIPTTEKVEFGSDYTWKDKDDNVIKTYTDIEKDITDKHIVKTADNKCDSLIYTLKLTVKSVVREETEVSATVCAGSTYKSRLDNVLILNDTVWQDSLRVKKDGMKVDSIYIYHLYIFRNPSVLPTTLIDSVKAVCGSPLDTVSAQAEIKAYLKKNFSTIHVDPDAQILWYVKQNGKFVPKASDVITGSQNEVEFQCVILDQCGNKLVIEKTIPVLDPDMVIIPGILVEKYGHWLLMLHVNNLIKDGYVFTEADVDWYQIVNGVERKLDFHGYYYTGDEELVGSYYAVINATNATGCNAAVRSNTVDWTTPLNAPIRLVPNFGHEGTIMRLENLNPYDEYQIYAYDEAGMLIRQMSVSGQAMTDIRAEGIPGIYMLRVVTDEKVETLRYIIK